MKGSVEDLGMRSYFNDTEDLFPGDAGAEPARAGGPGVVTGGWVAIQPPPLMLIPSSECPLRDFTSTRLQLCVCGSAPRSNNTALL